MRKNKGFTLIELLVVIAIIGILSSVVLASLNTARGKGSNAAIKSNLSNMMAQAANDYDTANTYGSVCTDSVILNASSSIAAQNGQAGMSCAGNTTVFSIMAKLNTAETGGSYWCVDANGYSGYANAASTTAVAANCK